MSVLPRVRLELARRPWLYWLIAGTCAAIAWASVAGARSAADHARQQWGAPRTVYVAAHALDPGDVIATVRRQYPRAMVPASAVSATTGGAVAARPVAAGEIVVAGDVAGAAPIPPDWAVFAVDATSAPTLVPGDSVGVFGQGARWCDGVVTHTTGEMVEVAVPPTCAEAVSAQVAVGGVVLARGQPAG